MADIDPIVSDVRMPVRKDSTVRYQGANYIVLCLFDWIGQGLDDISSVLIHPNNRHAKREEGLDILNAIVDEHAVIAVLLEQDGEWKVRRTMKASNPDDARWIPRIKEELHLILYSRPAEN